MRSPRGRGKSSLCSETRTRQGRAVDGITQAALGAVIGTILASRPLGKWALAWGAFFGILPELLESLATPLLDTARRLAWWHGPCHSLLVVAGLAYAVAWGIAKFRRTGGLSQSQIGWGIFTIWGVHAVVDCFSTEGAALLWPLFPRRVAFHFLAETVIFFTAPLVLAAFGLALQRQNGPPPKTKKPRGKKPPPLAPRGRRFAFLGLSLSAIYALLALGMQSRVGHGFSADLSRRGTKSIRRIDSPTWSNILLWRSVVDRGSELWVGYRSVFDSEDSPIRWTVYLKGEEALARVATLREIKTVQADTDGWWIARATAKGAWLGDLRQPETRVWGSKKSMVDSRLARSWTFEPSRKKDRLRAISPTASDSWDFLRRLSSRIAGQREAWEANPRLAGVDGSLPEFLPVEE